MLGFAVQRWSAWAPGLEGSDAWLAWLESPSALTPGAVAPLPEVPAMMRRRMDPLCRAALQVAFAAQGAEPGGPVVFASRWGEIARSVPMLEQLAAGEALSPTAFSLSVHNASSALFSMIRQDRENYVAVSAGPFTAEAGFAEALGLLADGAQRVTVVCFDAPLPMPLSHFADSDCEPMLHAWACAITAAPAGAAAITLEALPPAAPGIPGQTLPGGLAALKFLAAGGTELLRTGEQGGWRWSRLG